MVKNSYIAIEYGIKIGGVNKLIPNLDNKSKYVLHYRNLQLYLSLGMKLTKIHEILKFRQSDLSEKYIHFNRDKRKKILLIVLKKFFLKLKINSVYVKTMGNLRKESKC